MTRRKRVRFLGTGFIGTEHHPNTTEHHNRIPRGCYSIDRATMPSCVGILSFDVLGMILYMTDATAVVKFLHVCKSLAHGRDAMYMLQSLVKRNGPLRLLHENLRKPLVRDLGPSILRAVLVANNVTLHRACGEKDGRCLSVLLDNTPNTVQEKTVIDVDKLDQKGFTPLMIACQNGHERCALAVIEAGAAVRRGIALILACQGGHERCAHALLENGAVVDKVEHQGMTALLWACTNGHERCALAVIEAGAAVDTQLPSGHTALPFLEID